MPNGETLAGTDNAVEKTWTPWPGLHIRVSRLPDRDDLAVEVWRRNDHDGWDYIVLLPPDIVEARKAVIEAWLDTLGAPQASTDGQQVG